MKTKLCSSCNRKLPVAEFNKNRAKSDGLQTSCKECHKEQKARYYQRNRTQVLKYNINFNRKYYKTSHGVLINSRIEARKRGLDFNLLLPNILSDEEKVAYHHIDNINVIPVPRYFHNLYSGRHLSHEQHLFHLDQIIIQLYNIKYGIN